MNIYYTLVFFLSLIFWSHSSPETTTNTAEVFSAGFVIFRRALDKNSLHKVEYLLIQAKYSGRFWSFPKGHRKSNEDDRAAALRELEEECGIEEKDIRILDGFEKTLRYVIKNGKVKTVMFWLAELINPNQDIKLSHEHTNFQWLPLDEACALAKFPNYQILLKETNDCLHQSQFSYFN